MTARPMRPKSPLGVIRAGPPTLMPARRALQSAENSHQHGSAVAEKVMTGVSQGVQVPDSNCSVGRYVGLKRGMPDEGLGDGVELTLLLPTSWLFE